MLRLWYARVNEDAADNLKENRNYCQFFINECYKNMGKYVFIDPMHEINHDSIRNFDPNKKSKN